MLDSLESIYDAVSIPAPLARSNHGERSPVRGHRVTIPAPLARSNLNASPAFAPMGFQYLLLLRGATFCTEKPFIDISVSIPAPLARSNSACQSVCIEQAVSIPAPLARSNDSPHSPFFKFHVSIPAPLARSNGEAMGTEMA